MSRKLRDWSLITLCSVAMIMVLGLSGCGASEPAEEEEEQAAEAAEPAEADEHAAMGAPTVRFANVSEGDEVTSPLQLTFESENFNIEAVGEGEIHEGHGHYHIAINDHCLPAGEIIPQAAPWVHFGDGQMLFVLVEYLRQNPKLYPKRPSEIHGHIKFFGRVVQPSMVFFKSSCHISS